MKHRPSARLAWLALGLLAFLILSFAVGRYRPPDGAVFWPLFHFANTGLEVFALLAVIVVLLLVWSRTLFRQWVRGMLALTIVFGCCALTLNIVSYVGSSDQIDTYHLRTNDDHYRMVVLSNRGQTDAVVLRCEWGWCQTRFSGRMPWNPLSYHTTLTYHAGQVVAIYRGRTMYAERVHRNTGSWTPPTTTITPINAPDVEYLRVLQTGTTRDIAFSPDGAMLAAGTTFFFQGDFNTNHGVWLFDINGLGTPDFLPTNGHARYVAYDGDRLYAAGNGVTAWENSEQVFRSFATNQNPLFGTDEGPLLASVERFAVTLYGMPDMEARYELEPSGDYATYLRDIAFSETHIAGAGPALQLWTREETPSWSVLDSRVQGVQSVAFSPDGGLLAATGVDLRVYDVDTREERWRITHGSRMVEASFSPDGALLATGHQDGTVTLWDVARGRQAYAMVRVHSDTINEVAWHPDGALLATASDDGTVGLWGIDP